MTKLFYLILPIIFIFYCCKRKEETKYYWIRFDDRHYHKADTEEIFVHQVQLSDTTKISYHSQHDTIQYILVDNNRVPSRIEGYDQDIYMRQLADTTVGFIDDTFHVTKYIHGENVIDGSSLHYFTPSLGVFATHSGTWPGIKILQTSDSAINKKVYKLIKTTVPEFFIRGQLIRALKD